MVTHALAKDILDPEDIALLDRVLHHALPPNVEVGEKEWLAMVAIAAFQNGTKDEVLLTARIREELKLRAVR